MKKILRFSLLVSVAFCTSSCLRYQLLQMEGYSLLRDDSGQLYAKNEDLEVRYDFWSYGGVPMLIITNRAEQAIKIDWYESYWHHRTKRYRYYETPRNSKPLAYPVAPPSLYSHDVLAPNATLQMEAYPLCFDWVRFKNLKSDKITFNKMNSPAMIANELSYSYVETGESKQIKHEFWIGEIRHLPREEFEQFERTDQAPYDAFYLSKDSRYVWVELASTMVAGIVSSLVAF